MNILIQLLLLASIVSPLAQTVINGKAICAVTGFPVDSVRVAATFFTTFSQSNGDYSFSVPDTTQSQPDTTISNINEYHLRLSHAGKKLTLCGGSPDDFIVVNPLGQVLKLRESSDKMRKETEKRLSPGVYFLRNNDKDVEKLLLATGSEQLFIYQEKKKVLHIRYPVNPSDDTVYFCKEGYLPRAAAVASLKKQSDVALYPKRWVTSDFHNHTVLTDGTYIFDTVLDHAFGRNKLDICVNSEHGGSFYRDTSGAYFTNEDESIIYVPRWYTLKHYSWPKILGQRKKYPGKILLQGFEWNCPGHEHASVGIIRDNEQPDAIADFEYQFDFNDDDNSRPELKKKNSYEHSNALAALRWLKEKYPVSSYVFANHPSREAIGAYTVSDFRDFHNTAPEVFFGFEGMPGHQKSSIRGHYNYGSSDRNRTWGGADYILASVGGLWDALLGEGRHLWVVDNSDFHDDADDNWPGEYEKTWTAVGDTGAQAWLDGVRHGDMFVVHGDLINQLTFSVDDGILNASMGMDLHSFSKDFLVTIRFKSPEKNLNGDQVTVDHIDLISGLINGRVDPSDIAAYRDPTNTSTNVTARFLSTDWKIENGMCVIRKKISCTQPTYFRLRGTNHAAGTPGEVDIQGNPCIDEDYKNDAKTAWGDLWFYSNPIFVYPR